jgi:hypothetical protein
MDGQLLTLSKIFTERLFRIPDYQRGYAWGAKQLKDFWSDISQLEYGHNHYTGVLTLENVLPAIYTQWAEDLWIIESKNYQPFYLVDGQQRLTTSILIIQVILEAIPDGAKLNFTDKKDIQKKFIYDSKDDGISRSYIFGYEKDNPSYEYLKTKIFLERSSSSLGEETIYTQNLEYAKNYFAGKISTFSHAEIESLYKKVTQQLLFNIFSITEDVDVCVAFETMNNRGKPLSYLELLKNRLIYLTIKFNAPDYERYKLRNEINTCWKTIYHNLGRNKEMPLDDDKFLINHYIIYFGYTLKGTDDIENVRYRYSNYYRIDYATDLLERRFIPKNANESVSDESRITLADVYNYVSSLKDAVDIWYRIFNPFTSGYSPEIQIWLDKLNRLDKSEIFHPLLLVFLQKELRENKQLEFLKAIERILFINTLIYRSWMSAPHGEFNIIKLTIDMSTNQVNSDKVIKAVADEALRLLKIPYFVPEIHRMFRTDGFYSWDGLRYFLYEYNLSLQEKSRTARPKIFWAEFSEENSDYITVEHIYPRQARTQYWLTNFKGFSQKQRETMRNSLGNLLPLSRAKNSSLSNKPFPNKVDENNTEAVGYRYGCYAENEITKYSDWTPKDILDRGLKLLSFMEKRWGLDFGDEKTKITMLGVEFLLKKR